MPKRMLQYLLIVLCSLHQSAPYQNRTVGIHISLPAGATIVDSNANPPFCNITGGNSSNTWHVRIDRGLNIDDLSPQELVHAFRNRRPDPQGTVVLKDEMMRIGELDGWWLLLEQPSGDAHSVIGWLAIPAVGQQYILARIFTNSEGWKMFGHALRSTLSSIELLDPIELIKQKMQGLDAATALLANLSEDSLQPLLGFKEWRRIQRQLTASDAPEDIGYAFVSIERGYAHEIKGTEQGQASEPKGIVVSLRSRIVANPETHLIVDTQAQYWMSWDGKESRWWNRVTRWIDRARAVENETGIRTRPKIGSPKSTLLVLHENLNANKIEEQFKTFKVDVENPWLPRALVWVFGPLFVSNQAAPRYEWYMFDNAGTKKIVLRIDTLNKGNDGSTTITTHIGESGGTMTTIINLNGHLVRQRQAGGVIVTGSNEQELRAIWQQRGLW